MASLKRLAAQLSLCLFCGCVSAQVQRPLVLDAAPISALISSPGAQFTASNDGSSVALKLAREHSSIPVANTDPQLAQFSTWSLLAEAPISNGKNSSDIFSLDGFGKATTLQFSYSRFITGWRQETQLSRAELDRLCREMRLKAAAKEGKPQDDLDCSAKNFSIYAPEKLSDARANFPGPLPGGWLWGLGVKFGRQDLDFIDAVTLSRSETKKYPWSVGVYAGWSPASDDHLLLMVKLDRQKTFEEADETIRCPNGSIGATIVCVSGPFGPPTESNGTLLRFEGRKVFNSGIGVALNFSRDFARNKSAYEVPLYFIGNGSGDYIGGLRLAWDNQRKNSGVGLFVGLPISLLY